MRASQASRSRLSSSLWGSKGGRRRVSGMISQQLEQAAQVRAGC